MPSSALSLGLLTALRAIAQHPGQPLREAHVTPAVELGDHGLVRCFTRTPPGACRPHAYAALTPAGQAALAALVN